tara:strand:- start:687 stop:1541 length:855 start_codon:yes stop_codon:yes gene_type:complete
MIGVGAKVGAAAAKFGPQAAAVGKKAVMAGQKLGSYFSKEGAKKLGEQAVKAATSEGTKQAGKRALRDTILYSAAEQVIPRALGQQAPDIKDTLVRQATGNIIAEGATAGLKKAFPIRTGTDANQLNLFTGKKEGKNFLDLPGLSAGDARKIGEVTGQIGGQAIAQTVLPGEQANPFLPSTYMQEEESIVPLGVGPTTATGATKFTAEPEYNEVVRPSTTDLSNVQASEAMAERERYAYELQLAQIKNQPKHTYMHYDTGNQAAMMGAEMALKRGSSLKVPQYG